jgi:hypothetical protein
MDITLFRKLFLCQTAPILKRIEGGIHFRESVYLESPLFVISQEAERVYQ